MERGLGLPMSWKLVFALSLFGMAMGVATVYVVPSDREPLFWLGIFVVCAWLIAKRAPSKYFLHGMCTSLLNSVWITAAHVALFGKYVAGHAREVALSGPLTQQVGSVKIAMAVTGPVVGIVSGVVLGAIAWVLSKFVVSSHSEFAGW